MSATEHSLVEGGDPDRYRVSFDRAGTRTPDHPTHPEIQLLSPDFYADFDRLASWMRANAPLYWDDSVGISCSPPAATRSARRSSRRCGSTGATSWPRSISGGAATARTWSA